MKVLVTGATGFIGRALVLRLRRDGHEVLAWVRDEGRARALLGTEAELISSAGGEAALAEALGRSDAVVNLAGEAILQGRWTEARRALLRESRVGTTEMLVRALGRIDKRPRVLVSGSAVGFYGDGGDRTFTEESPGANDFLATLCRDWEAAANGARALGLRVVLLRTGIVLGRDGGALAQMLTPFRMGVGGPVGGGRQYLSWIHLHDLVEMITVALADERYQGPLNGTAPEPVTSRDFAKALGRALHRPAVLPAPAFALKLAFGDAAATLLEGQRALPAQAQAHGFRFQHATLDDALAAILDTSSVRIEPLDQAPAARGGTSYLAARKPSYVLTSSTVLEHPIEQVYGFFSRPENLALITPASMRFSIEGQPEPMAEGARIDYQLRVGPVPLRWRTRIEAWQPGRLFVDSQDRGPYRSWWHEHHFRAEGSRTVMEDRVYYAPPLGWLGRIANRIFVSSELRRIFGYRADVVRLRFGGEAVAPN